MYHFSMAQVPKQQHQRQRHFLAEWRKHRGLTQERAADQLQITQASLSRYENGKQPYNQDFLEAAAEAYGTDPASLLMRNPLDKAAPHSIDNKLIGVPQEKRAVIEAIVDTMLKAG